MNIISGFGGLPLGTGQGSSPPPNKTEETGSSTNGNSGTNTEPNAGSGNAGSSGATNDTAPTQSVNAPSSTKTAPVVVQADTTETATTRSFDRASLDAPVEGRERASAEQVVTKLFFDSLLSSISSAPEVTEIGLVEQPEADGVTDKEESAPNTAEADSASERFREGLKLVNEPV